MLTLARFKVAVVKKKKNKPTEETYKRDSGAE